jgi:hypothetical protein
VISHVKAPPASPVKDHDGVESEPGSCGAAVIVGAAGALRSRVKVSIPAPEVLPAASVAVTRNSNGPSLSPETSKVSEPEQMRGPPTTTAPARTSHLNVAPASPVKLHVGVSSDVTAGGAEVIVGAAGAVESKV